MSDWKYRVETPYGVGFASTTTEAIGTFWPEYVRDDPYERDLLLRGIVENLRALVVTHFAEDLRNVREEFLDALLSDGPPSFAGEWECAIPLLLMETDFAPNTPFGRIEGNVVYFDSTTELGFLLSLSSIGAIKLGINMESE